MEGTFSPDEHLSLPCEQAMRTTRIFLCTMTLTFSKPSFPQMNTKKPSADYSTEGFVIANYTGMVLSALFSMVESTFSCWAARYSKNLGATLGNMA